MVSHGRGLGASIDRPVARENIANAAIDDPWPVVVASPAAGERGNSNVCAGVVRRNGLARATADGVGSASTNSGSDHGRQPLPGIWREAGVAAGRGTFRLDTGSPHAVIRSRIVAATRATPMKRPMPGITGGCGGITCAIAWCVGRARAALHRRDVRLELPGTAGLSTVLHACGARCRPATGRSVHRIAGKRACRADAPVVAGAGRGAP